MGRVLGCLVCFGLVLVGCNEGRSSAADEDPVSCGAVCVEWAGPAGAFQSTPRPVVSAGDLSCSGANALQCSAGTACVENSRRFGAFGTRGAVCEVREGVVTVDVSEPAGAVDVTLRLTINGELAAESEADADGGTLYDNPYTMWVRPEGPGRDVMYAFDPGTGVAAMRLAPGVYVLEFDDQNCNETQPFLHRQARLTVTGAGEDTLDVAASRLFVSAEVDGAAVTWGSRSFGAGGAVQLSGLGGATCVVSSDSGNTALVQRGEIGVSAAVDDRPVIGVFDDQPFVVGDDEGELVLSGSTVPVSSLATMPAGWEVSEGNIVLTHANGLEVAADWFGARILAGRYTVNAFVRVIDPNNADAGLVNASWRSGAAEVGAGEPLVLQYATVDVLPSGWTAHIDDTLRAVTDDGSSATLRLRFEGQPGERETFYGVVPAGPASLTLVPGGESESQSVWLDAPTPVADAWEPSDAAAEFVVPASVVRVRLPDVDSGEVVVLPTLGEPSIQLKFSRIDESGGTTGATLRSYGSLPLTPTELALTLPSGDWRVAARVAGAAVFSDTVDISTPRGESALSLELDERQDVSVDFVRNGEVVWSAPWRGDDLAPVRWPPIGAAEFAGDGSFFVGGRWVH